MNSIVIELCAEDRARLDRLAEALERKTCDKCVASALAYKDAVTAPADDPLQQKLADTLAKASESAPAPSPAPAPAAPAPEPAPISLAEFQKAVVVRCAESPQTKAKVQALIANYADCVSNVPEGRRAEFLAELAKF